MRPVKSQIVPKVAMSCYFLNSGMEQWNDFLNRIARIWECQPGVILTEICWVGLSLGPRLCWFESGTKTGLVCVWE